MRLILLFFIIVSSIVASAQLVYTEPAFPYANQPVTVYFNASLGNKGLENYTADVYAHTGVVTDKSTSDSDWKHVKTNWGVNTPETKLTRIEPNLYKLEITESINQYYGVPNTDKVLKMAFVFRSADSKKEAKTAEGTDIFTQVYEQTISVSIILPTSHILVEQNSQITIKAASNLADSLIIFVDNQRVTATKQAAIELNYTINHASGKHYIKALAKNQTTTVADSVYFFIHNNPTIAELPANLKKGANYINDSTVTLVLHAPQKNFVYLLGDFNNWDISQQPQQATSSWQMYKTADGSHFWQTITSLKPKTEYAYQYFIDGQLLIADPYTEKILDPWNDKYITSQTYQNLKQYPTDKTTEIVSVFETAQPQYNWQITSFTPPEPKNMVIYEMLIRDFVETHSYKTIADTLNYIQNLGVNVLELMPVNEFEGNSSWGYNPSFYFAPDKYYGHKNDLKKLIDECHKRGIAVVIDMVLNHSYGQSPLARMYFENGKPATNNPWYNVNHNFTNTDAQWGYDFNHESAHTQALVDSINSFWLTQYKVDGFRFDFTKGFGNNIKDASDPWGSKYDADRVRLLKRMADKIWQTNPNAYVIFEHLSDNTEEKELANYGIMLWGNMNYNYNEASMGWNSNSNFSGISYINRGWDNPTLVGYMESHDEERMQYKNLEYGNAAGNYNIKERYTALRRNELCANFFLTVPGPKMIWQFGELGYDISIDQGGRVSEKPILWNYFESNSRKRLYDIYSALAKLKTTEPAFSTTNFDISFSGAVKTMHLNHADMNVTIIGNFDVVEQSIDPKFQNTGTWYDFYTGQSLNISDANAPFTLQPGEYKLYTTKQLTTPVINPRVINKKLNFNLDVYPNPANNIIEFNVTDNISNITITDIVGQNNYNNIQNNNNSIDITLLKSGIYIIKIQAVNGKIYTSKFVKI